MSKDNRPLSAIEIAALTAGVPCSGNDAIDDVIRVSLRVRTAQMVIQGLVSSGQFVDADNMEDALRTADEFLDALSTKRTAKDNADA